MRVFLLSLTASFSLVSIAEMPPDPRIAEARAAIADQLLDPESARWKNEQIYMHAGQIREQVAVCGEVNAKNTLGGYAGGRRYFVSGDHAEIEDLNRPKSFGAFWSIYCK